MSHKTLSIKGRCCKPGFSDDKKEHMVRHCLYVFFSYNHMFSNNKLSRQPIARVNIMAGTSDGKSFISSWRSVAQDHILTWTLSAFFIFIIKKNSKRR